MLAFSAIGHFRCWFFDKTNFASEKLPKASVTVLVATALDNRRPRAPQASLDRTTAAFAVHARFLLWILLRVLGGS